jgi:hypothetical protein
MLMHDWIAVIESRYDWLTDNKTTNITPRSKLCVLLALTRHLHDENMRINERQSNRPSKN